MHHSGTNFGQGRPARLTPGGSKAIEAFRRGDRILSRDEFDPEGPLAVREVEEVFVRLAETLVVRAGGREIRTTARHPLWVRGKGWLEASEVRAGDCLLSHDGGWVPVEGVEETGEVETVYNLRIGDYHTYFVGSEDWGFSVWAHNVYTDTFDAYGTLVKSAATKQAEVHAALVAAGMDPTHAAAIAAYGASKEAGVAGDSLHTLVTTGRFASTGIGKGVDAAALAGREGKLRRAVAQRPDATQAEYRERLRLPASRVTMWRARRRLGLTRKKKSTHASERDRPDVAEARRQWPEKLAGG